MTMERKNGRHLYGRGFLGLIPLIGAFIGIGLIFLGLFKYRDKKLVLIGFAAMIPTILIYGSLFYYDQSPSGRKNWTAFNKPDLSQLVKNIEFYKKEYGKYPDSLEQLSKEQQFLRIYDPVQTFSKTGYGKKYYYKRAENTYILFALGVDGIPFTKDDIFPDSNYFNAALTGLVRPNK